MLKSNFLILSVLFSFSSLAKVSFIEKQNRVDILEKLSPKKSLINIDAYRRELEYEKQNLSPEERTSREVKLISEKVIFQVHKVYLELQKEKSISEARIEVLNLIEKDIQLVSPEIREEIRDLSINALDKNFYESTDSALENLHEYMLQGVQERLNYLNDETSSEDKKPKPLPVDPYRKNYKDKDEVISALISEGANVRFLTSTTTFIKSDTVKVTSGKVSIQIKASFLGISIDAGPSIEFNRIYKTDATFIAEGLGPFFKSNGDINFFREVSKDHKVKRSINFGCEAALEFSTDYVGAGSFSVGVVKADNSIKRTYSNSVTQSSRNIALPETIGNKVMTFKAATEICNDGFLYAWIELAKMNVAQSLELTMKDIVKNLHFSHPKTTCYQDSQCQDWFNYEVINFLKLSNRPRCVEDETEGFKTCELRGLKGQNCSVFDSNGLRTSSGSFEYKCDKGLKCVQVQGPGWFTNGRLYQPAVGECKI